VRRLALAALGLLALAACSRAYRFDAHIVDGALAFVPSARHSNCLWRFEMVDELGQLIWAAAREVPVDAASDPPLHCDNSAPIRFGVAPQGMSVTLPARPLQSGMTYEISGFGGGRFWGRFRYSETPSPRVENLKRRPSGP
jgi:hypothetical protein